MSTRHLLVPLLSISAALAACSSDDEPGSPDSPGNQLGVDANLEDGPNPGSTIDCDGIIRGTTASSAGYYVNPGWSTLPAALQIVPSGGAMCGSLFTGPAEPDGIALIRSDLYGKGLLDFYQPAATALGCTSKMEMIPAGSFNTRTQVTLGCGNALVIIGTDTGYDFYTVFAAGF